MSFWKHRSSKRRPRRRRKRSHALLPTLALAAGLALLFAMAWGAHEVEKAERQLTRLEREVAYQQDECRRLLASWLEATSRERIVPRAMAELEMVEPAPADRQVVVLDAMESGSMAHPMLSGIRRGLDRYGNVSSATAGEKQP